MNQSEAKAVSDMSNACSATWTSNMGKNTDKGNR